MKELIQEQKNLNRTKLINNVILIFHHYILPGLGGALLVLFFDENQVFFLIALLISVYAISIGPFFFIPLIESRSQDLTKKLIEIEDNLKRIEKVHKSLDNLRDSMLFDHDPKYWQVVEKLELHNT